MGVIADALHARINEMQARHDQTMIEVNEARDAAHAALKQLMDAQDELIKSLDD